MQRRRRLKTILVKFSLILLHFKVSSFTSSVKIWPYGFIISILIFQLKDKIACHG